MAFNLVHSPMGKQKFQKSLLGEPIKESVFPVGEIEGGESNYAYVFECKEYYSYRAINELLKNQLIVKVATENMILESGEIMPPGSVIVPVAGQQRNSDEIYQLLQEVARKNGLTIKSLTTGYSSKGKAWGSPTIKVLKQPKVMVISDGGASGYEVGEVWHLLDQRFDVKTTLVSQGKITGQNLSKFNTLIMTNGKFQDINNKTKDRIKQWVEDGGQIICWKSGAKWLSDNNISNLQFIKNKTDTLSKLPYGDRKKYSGAQKIGGAIFEVTLDRTHPLAYGMNQTTMPIFRNSELFMKRSSNPFSNPIMYTSDPLMSGYAHSNKLEELKNTPAAGISHVGKGRVIAFTDNPNFRAFWYGTNKLFLNALFFGSTIEFEALK